MRGEGKVGTLPRLPQSLGMEKNRKTAPTEAIGSILEGSREAKKRILVEIERRLQWERLTRAASSWVVCWLES